MEGTTDVAIGTKDRPPDDPFEDPFEDIDV